MKDNRKEGAIKKFPSHKTIFAGKSVTTIARSHLLSASITSQADKWSSFWLSLCPALYIRWHKADIAGSSERTIISVISTTLARCWEDHQQRRKTAYHSSVITSCSRLAASATPCTTSVVMCLADRVIDKRSRPLLTSQRKTVQWPNVKLQIVSVSLLAGNSWEMQRRQQVSIVEVLLVTPCWRTRWPFWHKLQFHWGIDILFIILH